MDTDSIIEKLSSGARVTASAPLVGGVSAEVHAVSYLRPDGAEDRVVVRRHRNIQGKADRHDRAVREHGLLGLLHERGVAVPQSRLFVPPDTLVLEFIDGSTAMPSDPAPALAATLAAIHAIDVDSALSALPRLDDPLPGLMEWMPSRLLVPSPTGEMVMREEIRLSCGVFEGRSCLLHGDYWPGNVMWRDEKLVAVLDWEDAAVGDPLTDVACARVELCCARDETTAERFTAIYAELASTDMARLPWWDLFVSTAALQYMDGWGLAPEVLAQRRGTTMRWQARAFALLGII